MAEEKLILDTPLVEAVVPLPLVRVTGGLWVADEGGVTPLQSVSLWMGDTPLLLAAQHGHADCVETLLKVSRS